MPSHPARLPLRRGPAQCCYRQARAEAGRAWRQNQDAEWAMTFCVTLDERRFLILRRAGEKTSASQPKVVPLIEETNQRVTTR